MKTSNDRLHKTDQESTRSVGGGGGGGGVGTNLQHPKLLLLTVTMTAALKMIISTKNRLFSFVKTVTKYQFSLQHMLYAKEVVILCVMMVQVAGYSNCQHASTRLNDITSQKTFTPIVKYNISEFQDPKPLCPLFKVDSLHSVNEAYPTSALRS